MGHSGELHQHPLLRGLQGERCQDGHFKGEEFAKAGGRTEGLI